MEQVTEDLIRQNGNQAAAVMADYAGQGGGSGSSFPTIIAIDSIENLTDAQIENLKAGDIVKESAQGFGPTGDPLNGTAYTVTNKGDDYCMLVSMNNDTTFFSAEYVKSGGEWTCTYKEYDIRKHFKGWWTDLATLKAAHTAEEGDSAYVKDASPATTWSIYIFNATAASDNFWADSGTDADTTYLQTFADGQEVNEVHIVNDLTTGGVDNVLSAEQGKNLNLTKLNKYTDAEISYETINYTSDENLLGKCLKTTGPGTASGWNTYKYAVNAGDTIVVTGYFGGNNSTWMYQFYDGVHNTPMKDENDVIIGQQNTDETHLSKQTYEVTVPNGAVYVYIQTWVVHLEYPTCKKKITTPGNSYEEIISGLQSGVEQLQPKTFNILCLGNSLTQCTMGYVPWIIKQVNPKLNFNLYFTYDGGSSLEDYCGWLQGTSFGVTALYKYDNNSDSWVKVTTSSDLAVDNVLALKQWDLVTIQQTVDNNWGEWGTYYKPFVEKIHNMLYTKLGYNIKLGFIQTPTKGNSHWSDRFDDVIANTGKMATDTATEMILPAGTAIQNARTTYLNNIQEHLTGTNDYSHLVAGIGCLIGCYANALSLIEFMGSKQSIIGNSICPDITWQIEHNVSLPGGSGEVVGLTPYNIWIAQQCAVMATKYPLQLTDMVAKGMCGDTEIEIVDDVVGSSNPILSANNGDSWKTTLIAPDGTAINTVSVVMGSTDITSSVYDSTTKEINILNVSGKITITATLTQ